jgi:hypothetical protein
VLRFLGGGQERSASAAAEAKHIPEKLAGQHDQLPQLIELLPAGKTREGIRHIGSGNRLVARFKAQSAEPPSLRRDPHHSDPGIPRIKLRTAGPSLSGEDAASVLDGHTDPRHQGDTHDAL